MTLTKTIYRRQKNLIRLIANFAALVLLGSYTYGQVSITTDNFEYIQNFNTLSQTGNSNTWTGNSTIPGWEAASEAGISTYRAGDGSSTAVGLFSFGSTNSTDRALGAVNSGGGSGDIVYGVRFTNNSGIQLNSITIELRAEQWRRNETNTKGHHRVKTSYSVANAIDVSPSALLNDDGFINVPEAFFMTPDTTSIAASSALDGNALENSAHFTATFPVSIALGQQIFIRFYDEDVGGVDHALAVDDLSIRFSSNQVGRTTVQSEYNFFAYLDQGVQADTPDSGEGYNYLTPQASDLSAWTDILSAFYSGNWQAVDPTAYGYALAEYTDVKTSRTYFVLRKENFSDYFWGTYVKSVSPLNSMLVIQAPHPIQDFSSDRQAAAIFSTIHANAFMSAGISRCASIDPSPCYGTADLCGGEAAYRMSDVAHASNSIFHLATSILAQQDQSLVFVQIHGFDRQDEDPHFIISCGSKDEFVKGVPDYAVMIRENLLQNSSWTAKITHVDDYNKLAATRNVQGRLLNQFPGDICTSSESASSVTNRFLHIEQYWNVRKYVEYYDDIAAALNATINNNKYDSSIVIANFDNSYSQNFDYLAANGSSPTWGNNLSLTGWYAASDTEGLFSSYEIDDGNKTGAGLYSYGSNGSPDRALGTINSEVSSSNRSVYGALFENKTGLVIQHIALSFRAEQWRKANSATASQRVAFSYRIANSISLTPTDLLNNGLFTNVVAGDMVTTDDNTSTGAEDGNASYTNVQNVVITEPLYHGQRIFVRFSDENVPGPEKVVAIDDLTVSFSSSPLPVTWVSFELSQWNDRVMLDWAATNEEMCDRYEIERSVENSEFRPIETVPCRNFKHLNQYQFFDNPPPGPEYVYYRIAQYDLDGQVTYSPIRSIRQKKMSKPTITFVDGSLKIATDQDNPPHTVLLYDYLGRLLFFGKPEKTNKYQYEHRLGDVNGLFVVKVLFDNGVCTFRGVR